MAKGRIHHIELYVSDLEQSIKFWSWFLQELGYDLYQEWEKGKSYRLEDSYSVFVQTEERYMEIPYHRCGVGLNHLAFQAESREEVDAMTEKLIHRGINILYEERHPFAGGDDYYAVFFEDPDRINVEFVAS